MGAKAENDFAGLLVGKVYPLLRGIPEYEGLLVAGKPDPTKCRQAAKEFVGRLQMSGGVHGFGSRQPVTAKEWTGELFRAASIREQPLWRVVVRRGAGAALGRCVLGSDAAVGASREDIQLSATNACGLLRLERFHTALGDEDWSTESSCSDRARHGTANFLKERHASP